MLNNHEIIQIREALETLAHIGAIEQVEHYNDLANNAIIILNDCEMNKLVTSQDRVESVRIALGNALCSREGSIINQDEVIHALLDALPPEPVEVSREAFYEIVQHSPYNVDAGDAWDAISDAGCSIVGGKNS